jgi:hypothetical protein
MKRRNIKKIIQDPNTYGAPNKQFPRVTIRSNGQPIMSNPRDDMGLRKRNFKRTNKSSSKQPLPRRINPPIKFMSGEFPNINNDVCFVVGGGPSLNGFDFSQLNGFDTIAVNKSVEYIPNPTYFITTDYTYFTKASLPIEVVNQKTRQTYFVANMTHDYISFQDSRIVDTRNNMIYENLYQYTGVIESNKSTGFGSTLTEFSNGSNSGHCGIQLALLLGYKKIYLLGFDLNSTGQTHFHQSYNDSAQTAFKNMASSFATTLNDALRENNVAV